MIRTRLVTAMVLSMIAGIAAAQSSTTSTTSTQSTAPALAQGSASSRETTNGKGVVTDQTQTYTSATTVGPANNMTRKTTETTVTR